MVEMMSGGGVRSSLMGERRAGWGKATWWMRE